MLKILLDDWLAPALVSARAVDDLRSADLGAALLDQVEWSLRASFDALAPTHITVPSGSRIPVDYSDPATPVLAVRLQELFGARATPAVLEGRVPLVLHLLSPAHRPVQVTRDLPGFWRGSWRDVAKEMRGRYPKHNWPDAPGESVASLKTKKAQARGA